MRPDLMEKYAAADAMPTYKSLMASGVRGANGMVQAFPPNTGVGWYTMATGTYPSEHGSTNNTYHRTGENNFNNRTSFSAAGTLQADTLAAAREARKKGARVISIVNVVGSTLARESDGVLYTHCGPEIGVASTKAFTAQLTALYLLALHLARVRDVMNAADGKAWLDRLVRLPVLVDRVLGREAEIVAIAKRYYKKRNFLFLGRGINYPIALEGSLKLKEISYIHAEGYAAGEMKHGPIALIDKDMPVVVLAPRDRLYEKTVSNLMEVKARRAPVIAFVAEGERELGKTADAVFTIPDTHPLITPILFTIPLQLLAYHIAVLRGADVDQPRNLAKSVTVE